MQINNTLYTKKRKKKEKNPYMNIDLTQIMRTAGYGKTSYHQASHGTP